jgi:hypothetical protein
MPTQGGGAELTSVSTLSAATSCGCTQPVAGGVERQERIGRDRDRMTRSEWIASAITAQSACDRGHLSSAARTITSALK